jgi:hypothetical protein
MILRFQAFVQALINVLVAEVLEAEVLEPEIIVVEVQFLSKDISYLFDNRG